ncbi:UvrD-like helicase, ATP-binding domain, P-loop containing nucleoside triphosphate hydrolase [Tanacetum coccineum]
MDKGFCLGGGAKDGLIYSWCLDEELYSYKAGNIQLDDLVNVNSALYKHAKWKILLSDDFRRSFGKLTSDRLRMFVLSILLKLSAGWRPKNTGVDLSCKRSSTSWKQEFNVEGLYIVCTIDIIKDIKYAQVLKAWDILPCQEIPTLIKRLENMFSAYTEGYIKRCTSKHVEGNLEVPRCWPASHEMIRFRHNDEASIKSVGRRIYVENLKVGESLLLMKFYSLSREVVCHLLSGKDDIPMQATDEQMDILQSRKCSFIIGRSGTGKTTVLTMKLFQNEQRYCNDSEGIYEMESSPSRDVKAINDPENSNTSVLRQLFVTVSPRLCHAVKQHVSHLKSTSCNGSPSVVINHDDADLTAEFSDIPDTLIDIPGNIYPLVVTFQKFLMMLDGTLGNSFFERFLKVREVSDISVRSVALQTFIRSKEVTFDRFCSLYWPHFNSNLTKKLDPSRVFTEIISHIKGGSDGNLSYEGYSLLAESRSSTLSKEKREIVYTLFETYEKMKSERGDFDLGDLVNDIHLRLKNEMYKGAQMDFVYIDEVQDLSMRQIISYQNIFAKIVKHRVLYLLGDTARHT